MIKFDSTKHPRGQPDNAGQFAKKDAETDKSTEVLGEELSRELPSRRPTVVNPITKADYSAIRSEVFRKQSQKGYNKKRDYAYSADNFYVFNNGGEIGAFTIVIKLPIVGNEDVIDKTWRWLDQHG